MAQVSLSKTQKWVIGLHSCNGIGATPCGLSFMFDPSGAFFGIPLQLLVDSPFRDFLIPGIILFLIHGLANLAMVWLTYRSYSYAPWLGLNLGVALVIWIWFQVYWFPGSGIHVLQICYGFIGLLMIYANYRLYRLN